MRPSWWILALTACYSPQFPTGAPCVTDDDCPSVLVCATATMTCERADGGCPGCDGGLDVPPDAEVGCWSAWLGGSPILTGPRRIMELSSTSSDNNTSFAEGDLAIYLTRDGEILHARRPTLTGTFSQPIPVPALLSTLDDGRVSVAASERFAVFESRRTGGSGGADLWYTTRSNVNDTFASPPTQTLVATTNNGNDQYDPELSPDGLRLYYSETPSATSQIILVATRTSIMMPFGMPVEIELPGAAVLVADPTVSPDGRVIVFTTGTTGAETDLYFATRATLGEPFRTAVPVPGINAAGHDGDPDLSVDGCSLVFSSTRTGTLGGGDVWIADVMPELR